LSRGKPGFAFFMEMRTGKTKTVLDEFGELEASGEIKHLLVIAPAGVYRTWEPAIEEHLADSLRRRVKVLRWESKASPDGRWQITRAAVTEGVKIFLVNIEALSTVPAAQKVVAQFIKRYPTMVVVDESTTIKNFKANRTKFCLAAAKHPNAKVRRILSGLPTPQGPLDIFTQMFFLDPNILRFTTGKTLSQNFYSFRHRYAVLKKIRGPGGRIIDTVAGYQNLDELKARMKPYAYRVKRSQCHVELPAIYYRRDVAMTKAQETAYDAMRTQMRVELNNTESVTAAIVLVQLLRLHQICCGHLTSKDAEGNNKITNLPENRTAEMLNVLAEHEGKAIIWTAYDADVHKITAALEETYGEGSVARFWGGNRNTREDEEKRFLNDPQCRFMVSTAASGGRGRTWTIADLVIYHSNTFSLEHRMQSEERPQAIGRTTPIAYVDLSCYGTVEDKILHTLRTKMKLSDAVTGDKWKEWVV
jgi:SNF2 family DNA or RNA helicase